MKERSAINSTLPYAGGKGEGEVKRNHLPAFCLCLKRLGGVAPGKSGKMEKNELTSRIRENTPPKEIARPRARSEKILPRPPPAPLEITGPAKNEQGKILDKPLPHIRLAGLLL